MIICKKCKRQTASGEPTGLLRVVEKLYPKGKKIVRSKIVCIGCAGEEPSPSEHDLK